MSGFVLREFIYLDRQKVEDFLSSIEGGIAQEVKERSKTHKGKAQAKLSAKVVEVGTGGGFKEIEQEELKKTTDASLFQRLYDYLEKGEMIKQVSQELGAGEELKPGQLLEIDGELEFSNLEKLIDTIDSFAQFMEIFGQKLDAEADEAIKGFKLLGSKSAAKGLTIKISIQGSSYKFVATLPTEKLKVTKGEVEGRFKVLCRVSKVLGQNETLDLFSLLPSGIKLNRSQMKDFLKAFKDMPPILGERITEEDLRIKYPAAEITPIAIYR
ncbi:MAG: hypothetical protein AB1743_08475 [Actinomycetota bacterium]